MSKIKRICVYCGSAFGNSPAYTTAATQFGEILARNGIRLIYGCGSTGLMGTLARAVHEHGGEITGIIPEFLRAQERLFRGADEVIVTTDMHERKWLMFEHADAFVALPGGIGTVEELVEQLTWAQLGRHKKPILLANVAGYWEPLITVFEHLREAGFLPNGRQLSYLVADTVENILPTLDAAIAQVDERELEGETERVQRM